MILNTIQLSYHRIIDFASLLRSWDQRFQAWVNEFYWEEEVGVIEEMEKTSSNKTPWVGDMQLLRFCITSLKK